MGQVHFDEGLLARQQAGEGAKVATKAARGKLPSQKLTEEELIKFTARVSVQVKDTQNRQNSHDSQSNIASFPDVLNEHENP